MRTHRSYLSVIKKLTSGGIVSGLAHITGGGITENLPRILPRGLDAVIDLVRLAGPAALHAPAAARQRHPG